MHTQRRLARFAVLALAVVLIAVGCGDAGDTDTTAPDDAGSDGGGVATDETTAPGDAGDTGAPTGSGDGGATMSVGIESFDFDEELVCVAIGGAVSGTFRNEEGVEVSIDVPPEDWESDTTSDWEPPSLTLRDERDEINWRIFESAADLAETYPEAAGAEITNFSVDGSHATGNGMAIDTFAITRAAAEGAEAPQLVPVTFGFECG